MRRKQQLFKPKHMTQVAVKVANYISQREYNSVNHANETNTNSRKANDEFVKELSIAKKICRREDITVSNDNDTDMPQLVGVQDDSGGDGGKVYGELCLKKKRT